MIEQNVIEQTVINTWVAEKGINFRMDYVNNHIIPLVTKFVNKEIKDLEELTVHSYSPIWDTRNNPVTKKMLEKLLNIKLSGVVKRDKEILQNYLTN